MSSWTAVKIRGKRHGTAAEKVQHSNRRRPLELRRPRMTVPQTSLATPRPASSQQQSQSSIQTEQHTPLEQLPAEVLQHIFEYAANLALPLVSRELASKLSGSEHLHFSLTSLLLRPILGHDEGDTTNFHDLKAATRLLNSRFATWEFFKSWLQSLSEAEPVAAIMSEEHIPDLIPRDLNRLWLALRPGTNLLPPRKLFCPPFTSEKTQFLSLLSQNIRDIGSISPSHSEIAQEGLVAAVKHGSAPTVSQLFGMGTPCPSDLLRSAVIDGGCHKDIVRMIIDHSSSDALRVVSGGTAEPTVDFLDPVIWSWAEQEKRHENEKGDWLLEQLRGLQDSRLEDNVAVDT